MLFTPAFLMIVCFIAAITLITGAYLIERGVTRLSAGIATKSVKPAPVRLR